MKRNLILHYFHFQSKTGRDCSLWYHRKLYSSASDISVIQMTSPLAKLCNTKIQNKKKKSCDSFFPRGFPSFTFTSERFACTSRTNDNEKCCIKEEKSFITCILTHWTHYSLSYYSMLFYVCRNALHFQETLTCTDSASIFSLPCFQKLLLVVINYLLMGYKLSIRVFCSFWLISRSEKLYLKCLGQVIVFHFPRAEYLWRCSSGVPSNFSIFINKVSSLWQRLSFAVIQFFCNMSRKLYSWFDILGIIMLWIVNNKHTFLKVL